ncbi:hypothetical protein DF021_35575 [Burkholderia stagnalis]|uniref:Uncharacterized protein n=1 Tax=Burkholderia stagnalis TaxID=1503054 RepID=A0ABX9YBJ2_9BURK|nr:hypothetical protein DF158_36055 [Burkholderia stagnalis]RQQ57872.1 hypothetical protein DF137_36075 [Burkholderia stagnalis]RQQ57896.1 hypothetical protein DF139_35940 [Burkholderia stagnalis]RQQ71091.1 hypothetical protein DF138_36130 [Burkholderia stagnalis]RQQ77832.1 hypothetical protein DF134_36500 [Burkholderia stagnalis]
MRLPGRQGQSVISVPFAQVCFLQRDFPYAVNCMRSMKDAGLSCGARRETQRSSVGMAQGSSAV